MTIILTTHYLDEADEADQIYIADHGKADWYSSATAIKSQYASNIPKSALRNEGSRKIGDRLEMKAEEEMRWNIFHPRTSQEAIEYFSKKFEKKLILLSFVRYYG